MKSVVIIAPDFTPSSMPPALRVRFFAEHLPEYGWQPTVISTDPAFYENPVDWENEKLLSGRYEVIRTPALAAKTTRKFGVGDLGLRSLWHQWKALAELCRKGKVDLVFIPVPPNYSMALGRLAHRRFGVPYVIDYIDPYITNYYKTVPRGQRPPKWRLAHAVAHLVEPFSVRYAGHLVGVDASYTAGVVSRYPWFADDDATGIPYGGERGDFEYLRDHPRQNRIFDKNDGFIHISYVGRGGPDMLPALRTLFAAVRQGMAQEPDIFSRLRMHFVGTDYAPPEAVRYQVLPLAREMGLEQIVAEHPSRVAYLDALQTLLDSQMLVVVGSTEAHYTASKIFPYILADRPLLGIFHEDSSAVRILRETAAGEVVTFNRESPVENKIPEVLATLRRLLTNLGQPRSVCWQAFEPYTTHALTARLAQAFETAIAKSKNGRDWAAP
ncbi:MAG: glycosyltransferase [Terriglobales bacterium]